MTEWFKVTVLKTVVGQLTASSNLALSAIEWTPNWVFFLWRSIALGLRSGFCKAKRPRVRWREWSKNVFTYFYKWAKEQFQLWYLALSAKLKYNPCGCILIWLRPRSELASTTSVVQPRCSAKRCSEISLLIFQGKRRSQPVWRYLALAIDLTIFSWWWNSFS